MEGEGEVSLTVCNSSSASQSLARLYKTSLQAMLEEYQSRLQAALSTSHSEETSNTSTSITRQIFKALIVFLVLSPVSQEVNNMMIL